MAAMAGIIGGIGPESTVDYYKAFVAGYREALGDACYPSILVNSVDLTRVVSAVTSGDLDGLTDYLAEELERLARGGADFALLAANTPHVVFDRLQGRSALPLISIVEAACRHASAMGVSRPALFGTRFTMESGIYDRVFTKAGVTVVLPNDEERAFIHGKYMTELLVGEFRSDTRQALQDIALRLQRETGADALILGGTELPLLLRGCDIPGLPFIDTTRVHVAEAVAMLVQLTARRGVHEPS